MTKTTLKVGDLIKFNSTEYPQYNSKLGIIIEEKRIDQFFISIDGRIHPYLVHRISLEKISER